MQYLFVCPMPNCGHEVVVEAASDEDAVQKIMMAGAEHAKNVHPNMPVNENEMLEMVKTQMKKL
ncbi:hypothetical protein A3F07_04325 [candidate division WWE3 bacterium RIFCSPHIGHO2_12_FULL_38_15]|uniref:DUF1059 domain-containing protein n=1 Tax=candidate division WWE3 bacterium RIFCSPHIGHO2_02_FULL_38_14 TaxID=1802620 RepID=A0A1F4V801_UNCKA|nr:MAG: hypothetical protein A3F07_04325 [candidate division WWE3 bacterium RIFCSPHIGHO2_12_FULL_38_15]OGC52915.1 MAG: hypothetical protein A3B64_02810 [candidate division WWE3 bacterium RIFCSPLOWO2_01_FULL_37_24]OGC53318.1 MAG: hypothetical protein A3D91_02825 [candidate division WWE3 bacterium RIFCSPHIGHO2_02_FULL_38_14]HLB51831.1 DUF1059 domain-containing protein [Patescibacteria group bacterium]